LSACLEFGLAGTGTVYAFQGMRERRNPGRCYIKDTKLQEDSYEKLIQLIPFNSDTG